jgi:ABC-2 type transport system permease protein
MTVTATRPPASRAVPATGSAARAVIRQGLRVQRRSLVTWGLALGVYGAFMAAIFPSVRSMIAKVAEQYPSGLKQAFGVSDMSTVEGYVHAELFSLILPLAIGYLAIRSVTRPTVGAEDEGHLDTILALPLARTTLVGGSFAVTAVLVAGVLAILGAFTWVSGRIAGTGISLGLTAAGVTGVWALAVFSAGVAVLAAGFLRRATAVTAVAMGVLVGMYALDLAGRLAPSLDALRWLSAFRYYGAPLRDGLDVAGFAALLGAGALLAVVGALRFDRRDLLR